MTLTEACTHSQSLPGDRVQLPAECGATIVYSDDDLLSDWSEKTQLCQTAFNDAARWRALIAIAIYPLALSPAERRRTILLRDKACCFDCAVDQSLLFPDGELHNPMSLR